MARGLEAHSLREYKERRFLHLHVPYRLWPRQIPVLDESSDKGLRKNCGTILVSTRRNDDVIRRNIWILRPHVPMNNAAHAEPGKLSIPPPPGRQRSREIPGTYPRSR